MAKTQSIITRAAVSVAIGTPVDFEAARDAIRQLNWSFGRRPRVHFALTVAPANWATGAMNTLQLTFPSSNTGYQRRLRTRIKMLPDTVNVTVGVRWSFTGGDTGNVRVTVGGASTVFSANAGNSGVEQTATLAAGTIGSGWVTATIEVQRLLGSAAASLYNCRVQDQSITSSLFDPGND